MTNSMIRIHNIETNEIIDREMTHQEVAALLPNPLSKEEQAQLDAKNAAQAKLAALGLTAEDLSALGL
jgi:hypothetical protein